MDSTFLSYTLVCWVINVEDSKWIVVPVQDTRDADDAININPIIGYIELL